MEKVEREMAHHRLREQVIACFKHKWRNAKPVNAATAVDFLTATYDRFRSDGLADPHFEEQLTNGQTESYGQRIGELLLAEMLWSGGFALTSASEGPDFKIAKGGRTAWVELHTPAANGIPSTFIKENEPGLIRDFPHERINLRWTAAIAEKSKQLLGNAEKAKKGYIEKGIVAPSDSFVIAVNSRLLSPSYANGLRGISRFPVPVEVLFGVGPIELVIERSSGNVVEQRNQHRPYISSNNGSPVPANPFLDSAFGPISAVLGVVLLEEKALGYEHHSAMVYNPLALNPLEPGWVSAQEHWGCTLGAESYLVAPIDL